MVRVLQGTPITESPHQLVVRLDDRRVCLTVVAADQSEKGWLRYSEASATRAAATGDRLQPLLASGRTDDYFYVAYEVDGAQPLSSQLDGSQLSGAQSLQLLHGIGRGLDQAAASSFYPAEVTPDSVFVDPSRGAVLVDLGVAREALGNPKFEDPRAPWVAPEVLRGERAVERSTVYSLGALMYTLLTGLPPHEGRRGEIIAADPPSLRAVRPDLPEALEVVISTALAPDPRRRYSTAAETRSLANILMQGDLVPDLKPQPEPPPPVSVALTRRSPEATRAAESQSFETADARWETALRRGSQAALAWAASTTQAARRAASQGGTEAIRAGRAQAARLRQARIETAPRLSAGRWLPLALVGGVLALGVLAGVLLAGGPDEPPPPKTFSRRRPRGPAARGLEGHRPRRGHACRPSRRRSRLGAEPRTGRRPG